MTDCWYSISIDTWKTGDPNFGEVSNLKFFHMIDINEMAAIFQFFDNGWLWYSVSIDTRENWRPKLWGVRGVNNLKFFCTIDINEMAAIFQFFDNGQLWYSISIDTWKTGDPNFGGLVIGNFSVQSILMKWQPFFNFFIVANADIPFQLTLRKPETQTLREVSNLNFFCMIDINKIAAIFQFFDNGRCWYSISVDTQKTRDPNFGGGRE